MNLNGVNELIQEQDEEMLTSNSIKSHSVETLISLQHVND